MILPAITALLALFTLAGFVAGVSVVQEARR